MFAVRSNIKLLKFPFSFDEFNMSNNFPYVCVCVLSDPRPAPAPCFADGRSPVEASE